MPNDCNNTGSLNDPLGSPEQIGTNNSALKPYVAPTLEIGSLEISGLDPAACALNDQLRQEAYVAESLNISGAPINVFKLLGTHEQGQGSLLEKSTIISSTAFPGFPLTGINNGGTWKTQYSGQQVVDNKCFLGADFGIRKLIDGRNEYAPPRPNLYDVGAVKIKQADNPNQFARQVKAEIADGTCIASLAKFTGTGNGSISSIVVGDSVSECVITATAISSTQFQVYMVGIAGGPLPLGIATTGVQFNSLPVSFKIQSGNVSFTSGDVFSFSLQYSWKRIGIFNLIQSPEWQVLNFKSSLKARAVKITPTLFTGNEQWAITDFDVVDSAPSDINNIQDLFFNENRDRDYATTPVLIKAQYNPADSASDLSRFGLNILDQYSFTAAFSSIVQQVGRPLVVGDIIEVIPEMQYDQNLKPVRKFLEITDTGWASEGFTAYWKPTVFRFSAQQALPSQETRDIFGTIDTQKYIVADQILNNDISPQIDTTPLLQTEQIGIEASIKVPEVGSDEQVITNGQPLPNPLPQVNRLGNVPAAKHQGKQGRYIEDGLPPNGEPYGEGFKLPEVDSSNDGDYFRLNYPPETKIQPRLYRFSAIKNRWIYQETDRRAEYSSHKPSVRSILQSDTKQSLGKKT